ncbi:MAG: FHA domain-containing protein [Acidobacteriota bacterium]
MAADLKGALLLSRTRQERDFRVPDQPEVGVGYDRSNDVVVPFEGVSRRHARISFDGRDYWIEDVGSANGTFLNAVRLTQKERLKHLDIVTLGRRADLIFMRRTVELARKARQGILSARLEILDGLDAGTKREIPRGTVTIGRAPGNNIVADSQLVSKVHARVERSGVQLLVTDLQSANGTFVNGDRVDSKILKDGDEVSVGHARSYRVRIEEGEVLTGDVPMPGSTSSTSNPSLPMDWRTHMEWSPEEVALFDKARAAYRPGTPPLAKPGETVPAPKVQPKSSAPKPVVKPAEPTPEIPPAAKPAAAAPKAEEKPKAPTPAATPTPAAPAPEPAAAIEPPRAAPREPPAPPPVAAPAAPAAPAPAPKPPVTRAVPMPQAPPAAPAAPEPPVPVAVAVAVAAKSPVPVPAVPKPPPPRSDEPTRALSPAQLPRVFLESPARTFPLGQGVWEIGRDPAAAVRLEGNEVSRRHARLTIAESVTTLEDLQTVNGTSVNGQKIVSPRVLSDGDLLAFGNTNFRVRFAAGYPAGAEKPKN